MGFEDGVNELRAMNLGLWLAHYLDALEVGNKTKCTVPTMAAASKLESDKPENDTKVDIFPGTKHETLCSAETRAADTQAGNRHRHRILAHRQGSVTSGSTC